VPPDAVAEKVTEKPAVTVWLVGWAVIVGSGTAAATVRVASAEVTLPAVLVTTTL